MKVVIWVVEGTWKGCIDAATPLLPLQADVALLHVTPSDVEGVAGAASAGLLGRSLWGHRTAHPFDQVAEEAGSGLLRAAAARLGRRDCELVPRRGRVEREVVAAVATGTDLLVVARDGDRSRLGPHSLGPATRFVVDHAPCRVMLVWPDEPPGVESVPAPPPRPHAPPPPAPPGPPTPPGPLPPGPPRGPGPGHEH